MPKVYLLATVVALVTVGLMLTGCPKRPTVVDINPQFEATPVRGVMPLTVSFNDITDDAKAPIKAWRWDFGDGAKGNGPSPVHEYKVPGVYPVKLTITTSRGEYVALKENFVTVLRAGDFESPDPETNSVSSEGVIITVPAEVSDSVTFGITRELTPLAPEAFEAIILMSDTYTISNNLDSPELFVYDAFERPVPTTISMPLLDKLPVPVLDASALFLLAKMEDGYAIPIPGKVQNNRFIASVLRLPAKARYAVALRPETISDDSRSLEQMYQDRLAADDNWADYWKIVLTKTTVEEIAAAYYGDIEDEESFYRRDFTNAELNDSASVALAVAQAITNILADADMRVPTLVAETDTSGDAYYNIVMYDMQPSYAYDIDSVAETKYYDYFFGHLVVDPAQLLAISIRNLRAAAADPDAVDVKQKLSMASAITEAITKSTYAGYNIPKITTTGGGPFNLPVPADETEDGQVRPVDFMEGLLNGGPIYFAQRVEDTLSTSDVAADNLDFETINEELRKLARGFGENEYALLSDPLFFPYSPDFSNYNVSGQDFFCYLHNDQDFEEPIALLIGTIEAIAAEINDYLEEALYPVGFAQALGGMYTVMDEGITDALAEQANAGETESENLRDFYWKYLKDRAYINSGEALLRPSDVLRPPFSFNADRFSEAATIHIQMNSPTDSFELLPQSYPALNDLLPLSGCAVVLDLHSLTNELVLTFNTTEWSVDEEGYGPAVAIYKDGAAGVELGDTAGIYRDYEIIDTNADGANDTIIVRRLQPKEQGDEECLNRIIVVIGNQNYEDISDVAITVNAYSDLVGAETDVIRRYVYACDPLYEYSLDKTYNLTEQEVSAYILNMTSGAWRSANDIYQTTWRHQVAIVEPNNVRETTAMLVVSGGSIDSELGEEVAILAELARASQSVVALVSGIPKQPVNFSDERRSRSEDAIIAYSYDKYMNSFDMGMPEPNWPVLLPMTRAAVRAMDTVQDFMMKKPGRVRTIDNFVVTGASKRGWTTWLSAVAETMQAEATGGTSRVSAIIPMVIDVLNMPAQIEHHYKAYQGYPLNDSLNGIVEGYSRALQDYVEMDVFDRLDTPAGASLLKIVDPYTYRNILTMPKLIANSTGDQFFLPDSSKFYFDDMQGPNYLHYAANTDHSLTDSLMVDADTLESILAFYRAHVKNMNPATTEPVVIPGYSWEILDNRVEVVEGQNITYARTKITADSMPVDGLIKVWRAYAPNQRDFRLESSQPPLWMDEDVEYDEEAGGWIIEAEIPAVGWQGFFGQMRFEGTAPGADFLFTTPVRVVPDNKYPAPNPERN